MIAEKTDEQTTLLWRLAEQDAITGTQYPVSHEMMTWNDVRRWVNSVSPPTGALTDDLIVEASLDGGAHWHSGDVFTWSDAACHYVSRDTVRWTQNLLW